MYNDTCFCFVLNVLIFTRDINIYRGYNKTFDHKVAANYNAIKIIMMSISFNKSIRKKHNVILLSCIISFGIVVVTFSERLSAELEMLYELIKPANVLGYIKTILYVWCLTYIRSENKENKRTLYVILLTWFAGDIIDAIDGPIARYTNTASSFGEKLDHRVIDVFREPFAWMVLSTLYPEFKTFWEILLLRMFIKEDESFEIPRVPILPFINVAWYIPVICVSRYLDIHNNIIVRILKVYLACVFLSWGLEGDPQEKIRLDWYFQCFILRQDDRCSSISNEHNK